MMLACLILSPAESLHLTRARPHDFLCASGRGLNPGECADEFPVIG
jgi:hypothetical protein